MIAALLFLGAFLILGLAVVAFAFSGGSRGAATPSSTPSSRASRRAVGLGVAAVIVVLGVAVPTLVGVANGTDKAKQGPGGVDLTSAQAEGRAVFAEHCATCHTLKGANAVGRVGPNLDAAPRNKKVILSVIASGRAGGTGQMPAELVDGEEAEHVADFIVAVSGR